MNQALPGIHHVTAITADAQKNIDFYCGVLGLRLVKLTVNFDDPASYHLYYGDELGRPGTILTFFAWPGASQGVIGPPQVTTTAFAVPKDALDFWGDRLKRLGVKVGPVAKRFDETFLDFVDPDGMKLEIVATRMLGGMAWTAGPIPVEHAVRGIYGITVAEEGYENTAKLLADVMGFKAQSKDGDRFRFSAGGDGIATTVDLISEPDAPRGEMGAGVVHHVAYRTADDRQQAAWLEELVRLRFNVSPVMDRSYFHSIYFREPGGVLFEIATDIPGFTADEPAEHLGTRLMLPLHLEPHRIEIEKRLPAVRLPAGTAVAQVR